MSNTIISNSKYMSIAKSGGFLDYFISHIPYDDNSGLLNFSGKDINFLIDNWSNIKEFNSISNWSSLHHLVPSWFLLLSNAELADKLLSSGNFPEIFRETEKKYFENIDNGLFQKHQDNKIFNYDKSILNVLNMYWMYNQDIQVFEKILDAQKEFLPHDFIKDFIISKYTIIDTRFLNDLLFKSKYSPSKEEILQIDKLLLSEKKGIVSSVVNGAAVMDDELQKVISSVNLVNNLIDVGVSDNIFDLMNTDKFYKLKEYIKNNNNIFTQTYEKIESFTSLNNIIESKTTKPRMKI